MAINLPDLWWTLNYTTVITEWSLPLTSSPAYVVPNALGSGPSVFYSVCLTEDKAYLMCHTICTIRAAVWPVNVLWLYGLVRREGREAITTDVKIAGQCGNLSGNKSPSPNSVNLFKWGSRMVFLSLIFHLTWLCFILARKKQNKTKIYGRRFLICLLHCAQPMMGWNGKVIWITVIWSKDLFQTI